MAKRKKIKIPGVSFSAKRALGVTKAKQQFSRKTGIPLSKSGMQRKVGKAVMGGGCLINVLCFITLIVSVVMIFVNIL